jgi:hypothetical protein
MTQIPKVPDGSSPLVEWCRKLRQCVIERTLQQSPDIEIREGATGLHIRVKATPGRGGSTSNDKPVWL